MLTQLVVNSGGRRGVSSHDLLNLFESVSPLINRLMPPLINRLIQKNLLMIISAGITILWCRSSINCIYGPHEGDEHKEGAVHPMEYYSNSKFQNWPKTVGFGRIFKKIIYADRRIYSKIRWCSPTGYLVSLDQMV